MIFTCLNCHQPVGVRDHVLAHLPGHKHCRVVRLDPVPTRTVAQLLGVTGNQVWNWHDRRAANGFPEPVASVLVPQYQGDNRRAPLYDLASVLKWHSTYDVRAQLVRGGGKWLPREHGTERGYQQHRSNGDWPIPKDDPCGCRAAHAAHEKARVKA